MTNMQTKRSSKWLPEDLRAQVLGVVTRIACVEWGALKPVDLKLLHYIRGIGTRISADIRGI